MPHPSLFVMIFGLLVFVCGAVWASHSYPQRLRQGGVFYDNSIIDIEPQNHIDFDSGSISRDHNRPLKRTIKI